MTDRRGAMLLVIGALALVAVRGEAETYRWVDEQGNVTHVDIIEADPPGVFNKEVTRAMMQWKFRPEGEKFLGDVELNFTLKDG